MMAFEDLDAEVAILMEALEDHPEDWHEFYEQLRQTMDRMRAYGMPLPEDLVELERKLEQQFGGAAQKENGA